MNEAKERQIFGKLQRFPFSRQLQLIGDMHLKRPAKARSSSGRKQGKEDMLLVIFGKVVCEFFPTIREISLEVHPEHSFFK